MANIAIFRINYKSDFILTLNSDAGWMTPFCIKFWTGAPSQAYFVGFDGTTYTHCAPVDGDPTKLVVQFDDHHLPIGDLKFQIGYHFTVADFPTSVEDEVINQASVIIEVDDAPAQVMLDINGETAPEIQFSLPAYANEAQRIANEEQRIANETQRIGNEETRIQHEESRIAAEQTRQQNEQQRINQEQARVNEFTVLKRESEQATTDANNAAENARQKAQLAQDKATLAQAAAQLCNDKAALAQAAAQLANDKAQLAADKAALAQAASQLCDEKAALAQQKATYAQQQGDYSKAQGDYAKEQGDYSKAQGDYSKEQGDYSKEQGDYAKDKGDICAADHQTAVADHQTATTDHQTAAADHQTTTADHNQAGNDHTRAESDHTRAESDHAAVELYVDSLGVFDLSKHNAVGGVLATYADLSAALTALNALDSQYKYGGMSFKFVQTSDDKYVQFRYMPDDATTVSKFTNISNWQGVDKNPTGGSLNLVESGGVVKYINPNINISTGYYLNSVGEVVQTVVNTFGVSDFYFVSEGIEIINCRPSSADASAYTYLCFYDFEKRFISRLYGESTSRFVHKIISSEIPAGAIYFRVCVDPQRANTAINVPVGNVTKTIQSAEQGLIVPVTIESGKYLDSVGDTVSTETADFNVTQFVTAKPGLILHDCHPSVDADYIFVCFYDVTGFCVGNLKGQDGDRLNYTLQQSDIPEGAVYFRATLYDNGYIKNRDLYITDSVLKNDLDAVYNKCSSPVGMTEKAYLTKDGKVNETNLDTFNVTDYCPAKAGIKVSELHPASSSPSDKTYICFYDEKFEFVGRLKANSTDRFTYILQDSDIPEGAVYFRATVYNYGGVDYRIPANVVNPINIIVPKELYGLFDYKNVLTLDKLTLRNIIESSSNGRCTVLWDDDDYPSLMYKIPKVSIGALAPALGELTDVHPAFIVNSVEKDCVYVSVFQTSLYEGHYVSWFGLQPLSHTTLPDLRTNISNKGDGWHLETIYERSLIALLTMNLNSPTPTGNTNSGMSHSKPWEYCQLANGSLPGTGLPNRTGIEWINGTQPAAWSHNKEQWGIQDVIGGYHKICDLMKVVNGKIYLATDNSFFKKDDDLSTFENSWVDTGAAYDYINDNIVLNSSVTTPMQTDTYIQKLYSEIGCAGAYDNLSQTIRKKLCLLLMASRLSSEDANPIFEINGRFGVNNNKALCYGVFGGAEEYINSGLGSQITAYPIDDNAVTGHNAHYNMGSRIVYIE